DPSRIASRIARIEESPRGTELRSLLHHDDCSPDRGLLRESQHEDLKGDVVVHLARHDALLRNTKRAVLEARRNENRSGRFDTDHSPSEFHGMASTANTEDSLGDPDRPFAAI